MLKKRSNKSRKLHCLRQRRSLGTLRGELKFRGRKRPKKSPNLQTASNSSKGRDSKPNDKWSKVTRLSTSSLSLL
jgi:hypothetical protein